MLPVRLIAIDIDGTLLDSNFQVSAQNVAALRRANSLGIEIALVTGRRHAYALPVAEALGLPITMISSNGAVTRSNSGDLFHQDFLPRDTALQLVQHMSEFRKNMVITFDRPGKGSLVLEALEELNGSIGRWLEKNADSLEIVEPIEEALTCDPIQAMFCGSVSRMVAAQKRLSAAAALLPRITALKTQYDHRDLCIIDILNRGCSKGHALRRWAEHNQIPPDAVMAIGDNFNDIEMLEFAGIPWVMGNAAESMKRDDWNLTLTNDEGGVAYAVERVLERLE